jgi:hypothetical protein
LEKTQALSANDQIAVFGQVAGIDVVQLVYFALSVFWRASVHQWRDPDTDRILETTPGVQAVLVSADSLEAVRAAYPNFYADTTAFVQALNEAIADEKGRPERADLSGSEQDLSAI